MKSVKSLFSPNPAGLKIPPWMVSATVKHYSQRVFYIMTSWVMPFFFTKQPIYLVSCPKTNFIAVEYQSSQESEPARINKNAKAIKLKKKKNKYGTGIRNCWPLNQAHEDYLLWHPTTILDTFVHFFFNWLHFKGRVHYWIAAAMLKYKKKKHKKEDYYLLLCLFFSGLTRR